MSLSMTTALMGALIGIGLGILIHIVMLIKYHRDGYSIPKLIKKGKLIER